MNSFYNAFSGSPASTTFSVDRSVSHPLRLELKLRPISLPKDMAIKCSPWETGIFLSSPTPMKTGPAFITSIMALHCKAVMWNKHRCGFSCSSFFDNFKSVLIPILFLCRTSSCYVKWGDVRKVLHLKHAAHTLSMRHPLHLSPPLNMENCQNYNSASSGGRFSAWNDFCDWIRRFCVIEDLSLDQFTANGFFVFFNPFVYVKQRLCDVQQSNRDQILFFHPLATAMPLRWCQMRCKLTAIRQIKLIRSCWTTLAFFQLWRTATSMQLGTCGMPDPVIYSCMPSITKIGRESICVCNSLQGSTKCSWSLGRS